MVNELRAGQSLAGVPIPTTDDELWEATRKYTGLEIVREACCSEHVAPFRAFADSYFARYPIILVQASRGFGGKSILLAALAMMEAITYGAGITLLGGSGEQSRRVHEYQTGENDNVIDSFWDSPHAPRELIDGDLSTYRTRLLNGARIDVLTASSRSVHGPHPQRLRMDEIDEMALDIFDAALGQPMSARGIASQTLAMSTHYYPKGTMTEAKKRAAEQGWPFYEWCYRENLESNGGWLPEAEVESKKTVVTKQMWETEYENQEPSIDGRAFITERIEQMFNKALGEYEGRLDKLYIFEEYNRFHKYVIAADWAKDVDFSIIQVWRYDVIPYRVVAWIRTARREWPDMIGEYIDLKNRYNINRKHGVAIHDETGLGKVIHDFLPRDSIGEQMVGANRKALLNDYILGVENNEIEAPRITYAYSEHKYATLDDLFSSSGKHHLPDTVSSSALAYRAVTEALKKPSAADIAGLGEVENYQSLWE